MKNKALYLFDLLFFHACARDVKLKILILIYKSRLL